MNYAASSNLVPALGEGADVSLPWETGNETSFARQETWLLSFIDILALLLTLFVLLLAHQDRGPAEPGSVVGTDAGSSLSIDFSLQGLNLANAAPVDLLPDTTPAAIGYRIPGDGLLPREDGVVESPPQVVEVATPDPVGTEPQPPATASDEGAEPMTGVSANKNAGQTFVYYRGKMFQDSAVALMLSGDFQVALAGRLAKENAAVIQSAGEGAAEAMAKMKQKPIAVLAYNCAGRRSKLDDMGDELEAIQKEIGATIPLFGCYNAGEIGPLDASENDSDALCGGSGWHVMFTVIGR